MATLTVGDLGTVTYMIDPSLLKLRPGEHTVQLSSLLLNKTASFHIQQVGVRRAESVIMRSGLASLLSR